jgi:predicted nucleic acid-binding protein
LKPSVDVIVADAGPLIALARIKSLPLLRAVFARTLVTETVVAECLAGPDRPDRAAISSAVDERWLQVISGIAAETDWGLDAGEASTIAAALARRAGVIMDDRAGRRVASDLGVPVIGLLGVLVLAKRLGKLPVIRPLVDRLTASGYYLTDGVVEDALRLAGEPPE